MSKKPVSLAGRVAVITGSTRGIGRAIAETYGRAGARVVVSSPRADAVEHTVADLKARGIGCSGIACDVADRSQVQGLLDHANATWGGVDIWVNNAGVSGPFGYTLDVPPDDWEQVLRVNVLGCYNGCLVVLPHMLERSYGKIINVSGGGARRAQRFLSAYSSSKAAVMRMTDALAREYQDRPFLSINLLEPGLVPTEMITNFRSVGSAQETLKRLPYFVRVMGTTTEETAQLALRMASAATDGVSGKEFQVMPAYRVFWRLARAKLLNIKA